jgi:ketosteroid isomerase-like protein
MASTSAFVRCPGRAGAAILLLLVGFGGSRLAAQGPAGGASAEDAVRAVELARGEALQRADTAALSRMIADEFTEISRQGRLRTKADNMRDLGSGALRLTSVRYDSLEVRTYGDVAVLTGIADNTGVAGGMPFSGKVRYMRVFVRRDGRWQAVAMQQTAMP